MLLFSSNIFRSDLQQSIFWYSDKSASLSVKSQVVGCKPTERRVSLDPRRKFFTKYYKGCSAQLYGIVTSLSLADRGAPVPFTSCERNIEIVIS